MRRAEEAAAALRPLASSATAVAIVLGSGLNELAGRLIDARSRLLRSGSPFSAHHRGRA